MKVKMWFKAFKVFKDFNRLADPNAVFMIEKEACQGE